MIHTPQPHHTRRIYLLGQLRIEAGQEQVTLRGGKIRSLFAYLALHASRPHSRERLADMLWPDAPAARVRRNLSDALYRLRQLLGGDWLEVDREWVALRVSEALWVDVWTFEQLAGAGETAVLSQAVSLYAGDLLPEIYDDWALERRLTLRETYLNSLLLLGQDAERRHDPQTAHHYYHRLAHADPLREEAHRGLMRSLAHMNRLADALAVYDKLVALLDDELSVPPTTETQALATQLRNELTLTQKASQLPQNSLVQRPFAGRVQERSAILTAIETTMNGRGGLLAVEGEPGIGKSRLFQEIESGAGWRNVTVVTGYATQHPAASPFTPLADAISAALAPPRAAQLETLLPAATLAAASPVYPAWRDQETLLDLPPERTRDRFHQALADVCQALASLSPHLIILDDLHWADAALWETLDALVPILRQSRLLLLLAYRRPGIEQSAGWTQLQQWQRVGQLDILRLRPLTVAEITQLLPPTLQAEAEAVHASTGGVPFYISEMLLALAEGHAPYGQTAVARAQALPPPAQHALETAAVIGSECPYRLWAEVTDLSPAELAQAGDQLTVHRLLNPTGDGYAFTHDLIHQAIYEQIETAHRRQLHQIVADCLAKQEPENLRARAFHLDRAESGEAAAIYRQAGAQDMACFAFAEARAAFERALCLTPAAPTRERAETLLALAEACHIIGDRERQQTALNEALQCVKSLSDDKRLIQVLMLAGKAATKTGQHETARIRLSHALDLASAVGDQDIKLDATLSLGDLAIRDGQINAAKTHFNAAVVLARSLEKPHIEGRALDGLGFALMNQGQDEQSILSFQQALLLQKNSGDQLGAARTLVNLLSAYQSMGAWDKALELSEEASAAQQSVSYRLGIGAVRQTQGLAACMLGDFDSAHQFISQARAAFEAARDQIGVGFATDALGLVAERRGELEEAAGYYQAALTIARTAQAGTFAAYAGQDLGLLYTRMGRHEEAVALLETAVAAWREQGDELNTLKCEASLALSQLAMGQQRQAATIAVSNWAAFQKGVPSGEEPQIWLWTLRHLLEKLNRHQEANQILEAAYQELQRQARAIADHEMRRRFFAQVPTNRAIVTAYDRHKNIVRHAAVTLARKEAPLGRPLTLEEMVTVNWTITAPEDEGLNGKTAVRHYRLQRLLAEADAQGAAPTDDDLAQALGVSRRTILRDMETLRQSGVPLPTRRRSG